MTPRRIALLVALVLAAACNDRTRDPVITYEPPSDAEADAGGDASAADAALPPDELCRGATDGAHCVLPNATGVCVRQRCRFVACISGFDDCDDAIGCETPLDDPASCGACGTTCEANERCERGELTFTCTAGIACPVDRFDLDSDPANGCEVSATWGAAQTIVPPALEIDVAARHGDVILLAGSTADGQRVSTALPPDPHAYTETPATPARAVAIERTDAELRVLWSDGLSRRAPGTERFDAVTCADQPPRQHVGLTGDLVATRAELARVTPAGLEPVFGRGDYLAAFFPRNSVGPRWAFAPSEVATCAPCHFDVASGTPLLPVECAGPEQCRDDSFDDAACAGCAPVGSECPDFELVDLRAAGSLVFAITARGLVVLDGETLTPLARSESVDASTVAGGPRFVGADAFPLGEGQLEEQSALVVLYHSTGFVRGLIVTRDAEGAVDITPAFPDFTPGADLEAAARGASDELFVIVQELTPRVFAPRTSARSAWLTLDSAPGIQGLRPVAVLAGAGDGALTVLYVSSGQAFPRMISR